MSIFIFDVKYKNIWIKMKILTNNCNISPYLDKDALSKSIFKFENEKQLNKNIPLLKWSGKIKELPITFEYWIDEDNGCFSGVITFSAKRNIQDLRVSIPTHGMSNFETENHRDIVDNNIILLVGNINANESKTIEIKYIAADLKAIFPLSLSFASDLETQLSIERIYLEENEINDYEFRKLMEVEMYDIIDN
ncbi:GTPase, predicted [Enterocytozoon bieneusi H348]|nr:GTPase, predicted [Enterocytozoon bieneusi H348]|eukprot:XP_002651354.1 GTPase, predicted [Enterocytozoon bieneusi H348]